MPSKALLAAAASGADFGEAMVRVHRAIGRIAATENAVALGAEEIDVIDVIDGYARLTSPTTLEVDGRTIQSRRFVVATGARPSLPPIPGLRGVVAVDEREPLRRTVSRRR